MGRVGAEEGEEEEDADEVAIEAELAHGPASPPLRTAEGGEAGAAAAVAMEAADAMAAGHATPARASEGAATPASTSDAPHAHSDAANKRSRSPRGPQPGYKERKRAAKRARLAGNDEG